MCATSESADIIREFNGGLLLSLQFNSMLSFFVTRTKIFRDALSEMLCKLVYYYVVSDLQFTSKPMDPEKLQQHHAMSCRLARTLKCKSRMLPIIQ